MALRIGIFGLVAVGIVTLGSVAGCGGAAPPSGAPSVAAAPTSEMDYQKQQEDQRQANLPRSKTKPGRGKATKK